MKEQIRIGVFETNSSSIHTITVSRKPVTVSDITARTVQFHLGCFGWGPEKYDTLEDRASYLWTLACCGTFEEAELHRKFIESALRFVGVECEFDAIKSKQSSWNNSNYVVAEDGKYFYIDHSESFDEFADLIFTDQDFLLRFLFGNSVIYTFNDNDDYDVWLSAVASDDIDSDTYEKGN